MLLARPPRYSPEGFHVRLACLIHAANVRSEPGSNPSLYVCSEHCCSSQGSTWQFVAKPQPNTSPLRNRCKLRPATYPQCQPPPTGVGAALLRIGLIKKLTRFFFRGHPECQRSSPRCEFCSRLGARESSDFEKPVKPTSSFFLQFLPPALHLPGQDPLSGRKKTRQLRITRAEN